MTAIPEAAPDRPVWIHVGTLVDGGSGAPARDAHVVYDSRAILFVGRDGRTPPQALLRPGQAAPDLSAPDATLLPGLLEAHAHFFLEGGELDAAVRAAYLKKPATELLEAAGGRLGKVVRLGIAGVRDAGDRNGVGIALSRLYRSAGRPLMPYVDSPGAAIHHRGCYGAFMAEPLEDYPSARACGEARLASGADRLKLIPTGIINFKKGAVTSQPQMTTEEVAALASLARERGVQSFAHASGDAGIERAVAGGVDSVEHGFFVRPDQLERMRDLGIAWVPTFAPVQRQVDHAAIMGWDAQVVSNLQRILDGHARSLGKAQQLGVTVMAGSDAGSYAVPHGTGLLYELELMERAGMPASAVLHAATGAAADRLGFHEKLGRIAPGHLCRLILTRHPPLETVANLSKPRTIIFDGQVLETGEAPETGGL